VSDFRPVERVVSVPTRRCVAFTFTCSTGPATLTIRRSISAPQPANADRIADLRRLRGQAHRPLLRRLLVIDLNGLDGDQVFQRGGIDQSNLPHRVRAFARLAWCWGLFDVRWLE
jgi:hypothetical protein